MSYEVTRSRDRLESLDRPNSAYNRSPLNRLSIPQSLHSQFMTLMWRTTVFNLGRVWNADLLFTQAGVYKCVHDSHLNCTGECCIRKLHPFDSHEQIVAPLSGRQLNSSTVVEVEVDFESFAWPKI